MEADLFSKYQSLELRENPVDQKYWYPCPSIAYRFTHPRLSSFFPSLGWGWCFMSGYSSFFSVCPDSLSLELLSPLSSVHPPSPPPFHQWCGGLFFMLLFVRRFIFFRSSCSICRPPYFMLRGFRHWACICSLYDRFYFILFSSEFTSASALLFWRLFMNKERENLPYFRIHVFYFTHFWEKKFQL